MNRQRIGAYALACAEGRILLCRMSGRTPTPGRWTLPGGGVEHGESPEHAVLRELAEETGLRGTIAGFIGVHSNVYVGPTSGDNIHGIRLIYQVDADGQPTHRESAGSTDSARWIPRNELDGLDLSEHARYAAALLAGPS